MIGKLVGALLLILAGILACRSWITEKRYVIRLTEEFAAALERMEGMIRWQNLPLSRILEQEKESALCGSCFEEIGRMIEEGMPLPNAWQAICRAMSAKQAGELLCRVELHGDAQQIMGSLHLTARELRTLAASMAEHQKQNERLCVAFGGCITAMLVIVLI